MVHFQEFCDLIDDKTHSLYQKWVPDLNRNLEYLSFCVGDHTYPNHVIDGIMCGKKVVGKDDFASSINQVKEQCCVTAKLIILELDSRFADQDVMNTLGIVFPQYWLNDSCEDTFQAHLTMLLKHYCEAKWTMSSCGKSMIHNKQVQEPLNGTNLKQQQAFFTMTMVNKCQKAMNSTCSMNPLTRLWQNLNASHALRMKISEYFLLVEIVICSMIGSVEDERTFFTVTFIKSKLRNCLGPHLVYIVQMFSQDFFVYDNFPFPGANNTLEGPKRALIGEHIVDVHCASLS